VDILDFIFGAFWSAVEWLFDWPVDWLRRKDDPDPQDELTPTVLGERKARLRPTPARSEDAVK